MKKLFALLLAVIMVLSLVACTTSGSNTTTPPANSSNGDDIGDSTAGRFPLKEEKVIKVAVKSEDGLDVVNKMLEKNTLWQEIYAKTNVKIEIVLWSDATISGMFQQGHFADVVMLGGDATLADTLVGADLLKPLDEYVDDAELMPNLKEYVWDALPEARATFTYPDGYMYAMGGYNSNKSQLVENYLWINKKWLDKAGLDVPTNWAELERALEAFVAPGSDMNGNGKDDEIGYLVNNDAFGNIYGLFGMGTKGNMYSNNAVFLDDGEAVFALTDERYKDFLKAMRTWWEKGLIYDGAFGDTSTDVYDPIWRKKYGGEARIGLVLANNMDAYKGSEEYVIMNPVAYKEEYGVEWYIHPGYMGIKAIYCIPKTTSDETAELFMSWIDQFYTPEMTVRTKHGEADSVYRVTLDDGSFTVVTPTADIMEATQFTSKNVLNMALQNWPTVLGEGYWDKYLPSDAEKKVENAFKVYTPYLNKEVWPNPSVEADRADRMNELRTDIYNFCDSRRAKWIAGEGDIDADWASYVDQLNKMGVDELMEILQDAYDIWEETYNAIKKD